MFQPCNAHKVGLAIGAMLGLWHFCWTLLVALGLAQPLLNLVMLMHMIQPTNVIMPFSWIYALGLIVLSTFFGYAVGYVATLIWNYVHMCCE